MTLVFLKERKENDMDKAIEIVLMETVADFLEDIEILQNRADDDKEKKEIVEFVKKSIKSWEKNGKKVDETTAEIAPTPNQE